MIWELANEIEQISYRLESIKTIIEIIAERNSDNSESGALWGCSDMLQTYIRKLEQLSDDALHFHREEKEADEYLEKIPKGNKK